MQTAWTNQNCHQSSVTFRLIYVYIKHVYCLMHHICLSRLATQIDIRHPHRKAVSDMRKVKKYFRKQLFEAQCFRKSVWFAPVSNLCQNHQAQLWLWYGKFAIWMQFSNHYKWQSLFRLMLPWKISIISYTIEHSGGKKFRKHSARTRAFSHVSF